MADPETDPNADPNAAAEMDESVPVTNEETSTVKRKRKREKVVTPILS